MQQQLADARDGYGRSVFETLWRCAQCGKFDTAQGDEIMSTYDATIGSRHFTLNPRAHRKNGNIKPSTEYQAGFEAGFIVGREAELKEAEAGKAPVARLTADQNNVPVLLRPRVASDHFLLGLPCRACGAYYASDQERCPVCKASRTTLETCAA